MTIPLLRSALIGLFAGAIGVPAVAQTAKQPVPFAKAGTSVAGVGDKEPADPAGVEFFEKKVRPVLAQYCYACHSEGAKRALGNFTLDTRKG